MKGPPEIVPRDRYGRRQTLLIKPIVWVLIVIGGAVLFAFLRRPSNFVEMFTDALFILGLFALVVYHMSGIAYYNLILRIKNPSLYAEMEQAKVAARQAREEAIAAARAKAADEKNTAAIAAEEAKELRQIEENSYRFGALVPIATNVMAKPGETFYWQCNDAKSIAEHSHSQYVTHYSGRRTGGYSGVSFRVASGVYLHTGSTGGSSTGRSVGTTEKWTTIDADDQGTLWLSDKRAVFLGKHREIEVAYPSITTATPYTDGFRIDRANHKPIILHTGSPKEAIVLQRLIHGRIQADDMWRTQSLEKLHAFEAQAEALHASDKMDDASYFKMKAQFEEVKQKLGETQATTQLERWIGPDDAETCEDCHKAFDGNPYAFGKAPKPGSLTCGARCRHMVQVVKPN